MRATLQQNGIRSNSVLGTHSGTHTFPRPPATGTACHLSPLPESWCSWSPESVRATVSCEMLRVSHIVLVAAGVSLARFEQLVSLVRAEPALALHLLCLQAAAEGSDEAPLMREALLQHLAAAEGIPGMGGLSLSVKPPRRLVFDGQRTRAVSPELALFCRLWCPESVVVFLTDSDCCGINARRRRRSCWETHRRGKRGCTLRLLLSRRRRLLRRRHGCLAARYAL